MEMVGQAALFLPALLCQSLLQTPIQMQQETTPTSHCLGVVQVKKELTHQMGSLFFLVLMEPGGAFVGPPNQTKETK